MASEYILKGCVIIRSKRVDVKRTKEKPGKMFEKAATEYDLNAQPIDT